MLTNILTHRYKKLRWVGINFITRNALPKCLQDNELKTFSADSYWKLLAVKTLWKYLFWFVVICFQLDSGFGGICAIEPLHTGHGDDINILIGVTNNNIVEGSLNSPFHPVVQVCSHGKKRQWLKLSLHCLCYHLKLKVAQVRGGGCLGLVSSGKIAWQKCVLVKKG